MSNPKYDLEKLDVLRKLREAVGLTQQQVAEFFGLGERGRDSVRNWEYGESKPKPARRPKFIGYLLDKLLLRRDPAEFERVWKAVMMDEWDWKPLSDDEWQEAFPGQRISPNRGQSVGQHQQDWGDAPDTSALRGRKKALAQLKQWIVNDRCRLVGVLGIGGIGKTLLVAKLSKVIENQFDYVIWRSLLNAPSVEEILGECIQFFSKQQQSNLPQRVDRQIRLVLEHLGKHRCLLILDNVETILQEGDRAGHYRDGYEEYGQLIQRVGETPHKSCLILTSREKPKELALLEGKDAHVRQYQLSGLKLPAVQQMLDDKELSGQDKDWEDLNELYSGNPLALKLVSETIREVFDGEIVRFLNEGKPISGDVWELLNQQFNRLSPLEQTIMFWLAIEREAISLVDLQENIAYLPPTEPKQDALELQDALASSLGRRALIERAAAGFTLQNMVMEYVTNRLIGQICAEIINGTVTIFKSHALIKAQAKENVRQSQERVILKPVAEKLLSTLGHKKKIARLLADILSSLREKPLPESAYAAGNVLNLLVHLEYDLTGFDFSRLAVWQAVLWPFRNGNAVDLTGQCFDPDGAWNLSGATRLGLANARGAYSGR